MRCNVRHINIHSNKLIRISFKTSWKILIERLYWKYPVNKQQSSFIKPVYNNKYFSRSSTRTNQDILGSNKCIIFHYDSPLPGHPWKDKININTIITPCKIIHVKVNTNMSPRHKRPLQSRKTVLKYMLWFVR